jgi:hypothetical protein
MKLEEIFRIDGDAILDCLLHAGNRTQDFVLKEIFDPLSCGNFEISLDMQFGFSYTKLRKVSVDESCTYI